VRINNVSNALKVVRVCVTGDNEKKGLMTLRSAFLPCDAERGYATVCRQSVCLYVCL